MKQDFSELVEYLDKKFSSIDREINLSKEEIKKDFHVLQTAVDASIEQTEPYAQEMTMLGHQVDRHENWIDKAQIKVGIKFEH